VTPIEDVLPGAFQRLHASPDGALWLITDQSVARVVDTIWTVCLTGFAGTLAGIDASKRVWIVNEDTSEISAWDGASWTVYGADAGWLAIPLNDERGRDVGWGQSDGSGRFWLATSQDVRLFDGERWTVFAPEDMGMEEVDAEAQWATFALRVSQSSGTVWVGECIWSSIGPSFGGQGARWFDGQVWHGADSPVASGCATAIEEDSLGRVWLGVDEILWRYDPASGNWTQFTPPEPPIAWTRFGFAHAIVLDQSDDPWPAMVLCGASCYGKVVLYHIHDGVWTQIGEAQEFYGVSPHQLVAGAAGQLWLFWEGGVYRITGDVAETVTDLYIQSVTVDATGQVWLVARDEGRDVLWAFNTGTDN